MIIIFDCKVSEIDKEIEKRIVNLSKNDRINIKLEVKGL